MIIKNLEVGPIMANCFILGCEETREAVVIDPGDDAPEILSELADAKLKVKYILNTHGHFDHVGANKKMKEATNAPILIHKADTPMLPTLSAHARMFGLSAENSPEADKFIEDGDLISFGKITLISLIIGLWLEQFGQIYLSGINSSRFFGSLSICVIITVVFSGIFLLTAYLFRIEEVRILMRRVYGKFGRK